MENGKTLELKLYECYEDCVCCKQRLYSVDSETPVSFLVFDLDEYPGLAVIGKELFDADMYVKALKLGMQLGKNGYTDIHVELTQNEFPDTAERKERV